MVMLLEALDGEGASVVECGGMEKMRGIVIDLEQSVLLEEALEELIEGLTEEAEALGESGCGEGVELGFLDEHGGALFEGVVKKSVEAFAELGAMAFSAGREGIEDLSTRDGGAVFGEALEAAQDQAIVGKDKDRFIEQKVSEGVLCGFDVRGLWEPQTAGDLLGAEVAEQRSPMFERLGQVRKSTQGNSDLAGGLEAEIVGQDLSACEGFEWDALEVHGGTLSVMGFGGGLVMNMEAAYAALLGEGEDDHGIADLQILAVK